MKNRYRNPWHDPRNPKWTREFYENDAPKVFSYRGVDVYRVGMKHFDYVMNGCAITQRAGCDCGSNARVVIDALLSSKDALPLNYKPLNH